MIRGPFVRHTGVLTAANIANAGLSLIQLVLVARWLGPELFGVAALVMSYPGLVYQFLEARSQEATVRYLSGFRESEDADRALMTCKLGYAVDLLVALVALAVILATAGWAAEAIVHRAETRGLLILYAAAFVPQAFGITSRSVLVALRRFGLVAGVGVVGNFVRSALVIGFVYSGWEVSGVIWGHAIGMTAEGIVFVCVAWAISARHWGGRWIRARSDALQGWYGEILRFLGYTNLNSLLGTAVKRLDLIVLGFVAGPASAGQYRLGKSIYSGVSILAAPLQTVAYPTLSAIWAKGNRERFRASVRRYATRIGLPLGVAALIAVPVVPLVLTWLAGAKYGPAGSVAQVLLVSGAIFLGLFWLRPVYLSTGRVEVWTVLGLANGLFALFAYPVGATYGGAMGVAIVLLMAGMVRYVPGLIYIFQSRMLDDQEDINGMA